MTLNIYVPTVSSIVDYIQRTHQFHPSSVTPRGSYSSFLGRIYTFRVILSFLLTKDSFSSLNNMKNIFKEATEKITLIYPDSRAAAECVAYTFYSCFSDPVHCMGPLIVRLLFRHLALPTRIIRLACWHLQNLPP